MKCKKESAFLIRKQQLYLKNIFYHDKKNFMFISNMSNKNIQNIKTKIESDIKNLYNKQPQTITYTTTDMLKIVNFAFKTIIKIQEN